MTSPAFVRIRNLTKSYGANRVLDGIDLDIREGETRCIIGPSGSGRHPAPLHQRADRFRLRCPRRRQHPRRLHRSRWHAKALGRP